MCPPVPAPPPARTHARLTCMHAHSIVLVDAAGMAAAVEAATTTAKPRAVDPETFKQEHDAWVKAQDLRARQLMLEGMANGDLGKYVDCVDCGAAVQKIEYDHHLLIHCECREKHTPVRGKFRSAKGKGKKKKMTQPEFVRGQQNLANKKFGAKKQPKVKVVVQRFTGIALHEAGAKRRVIVEWRSNQDPGDKDYVEMKNPIMIRHSKAECEMKMEFNAFMLPGEEYENLCVSKFCDTNRASPRPAPRARACARARARARARSRSATRRLIQ